MAGTATLQATYGSTSVSFDLAGPPMITLKPQTGEIQRQTGELLRADILDAPRSRSTITGIGVSRIIKETPNAETRAWEMKNIDAWPGVWCLGPSGQTTTDISLTRQVLGFAEGISKVFYFAENTTNSRENIAYFVGSTVTWTDATATADWEAGDERAAASYFSCRAMWEHNDSGTVRMYALRSVNARNDADTNSHQLMSSTDATTWTVINHATNAATPSGDATAAGADGATNAYGGIDINGTSYCLTYSGTTVTLRQATGTLATWSSSTGGTLASSAAPIAFVKWINSTGSQQPYVIVKEGIYRYTGTAFVLEVEFTIKATNNGVFAQPWQPAELGTQFLVVPNGERLFLFWWDSDGKIQPKDITPTFRTQGLPTLRQGEILALTVSRQFLWAWIGGADSSHIGGWYKNAYADPNTWIGPVYAAAAHTRQARAAIFSAADDSTSRLHFSVDNGTASDTDQLFFANIDYDPRTVTSYLHTAALGSMILPKDDFGLPEMAGKWRKVEVTGTNFSASNKIDDVFAVADAVPIASDGSWGTTLGEITASGGSVNFAATPSGTGASAKAQQVRVDLIGASNASPYVETLNIYVKKEPTDKWMYAFPIDLESKGTIGAKQKLLTDLKNLVAASTDLSVIWGGRAATVMEPYKQLGKALQYVDEAGKVGTINAIANPKQTILTLVEV